MDRDQTRQKETQDPGSYQHLYRDADEKKKEREANKIVKGCACYSFKYYEIFPTFRKAQHKHKIRQCLSKYWTGNIYSFHCLIS